MSCGLVLATSAFSCGPQHGAEASLDRDEIVADATRLLEARRTDAAVERLRPLATRAFDPAVSLLYGRALLENDQESLAIWPLERVVSSPESPDEARKLLTRALLYGGGSPEAIREATTYLELHPEDAEIRRIRAEAYKATLDMDSALADLEKLITEAPRDPRLLESKIDFLIELERFDEARKAIEQLGELVESPDVPPNVSAYFCGAVAHFELERGDSAKALAQLDRCLARFPEDPIVIFTRVDVLDALDRGDEATRFLEDVAARIPGQFAIQDVLASRLARLDRPDEAEAVLQKAGERGGSQPLLSLADLRVARGDSKGAASAVIEALRRELGKGPDDAGFDWRALSPDALFAFGDVLVSAEDFAHAEQIIEVLDEDVYSLLLRARLALVKEDSKEALELYEQAFRLWPANPGARYLAGVAAMNLGEFERAEAYYQDALRADAAANDAGIVLARMQMAQGLAGAAFDSLETFLRKNERHPLALRLIATTAIQAGVPQYGEAARAELARDSRWQGLAIADHAHDLARIKGFDAAREYLESLRELRSESNFEALSAWVDVLAGLGRFDEAANRVAKLHRATKNPRGFAVVWARVLSARHDFSGARAVLEPVVRAEPGLRAAHVELGRVLLALNESDEAYSRFAHADRLDPGDPEAGHLACGALAASKKTSEARTCLEKLVRRHPWHSDALVDLLELRIAEGRKGERELILARQAERYLESAQPASVGRLGRSWLELGRPQDAARILTRAVEQGGATTSDRFALARAWIALDRTEEAGALLDALLEDPSFPERASALTVRAGLSPSEPARAALEDRS